MSPNAPKSGSDGMRHALLALGATFVAANAVSPELRQETLEVAGAVTKAGLDATSGKAYAGAYDFTMNVQNVDDQYGTNIEGITGSWYDAWSLAGDPALGATLSVGIDSDGDAISDQVQLSVDGGSRWTDKSSDFTGAYLFPSSYNPDTDHLGVSNLDGGSIVVADGYGSTGAIGSSTEYPGLQAGVGCEDPSTGNVWGAVSTGTAGVSQAALLTPSGYTTYDIPGYNEANFCYIEGEDIAFFNDVDSGNQLIIMEHPFTASPVVNETGVSYMPFNPQLATGTHGVRFDVGTETGEIFEWEDPTTITSSGGGTDTGEGDTASDTDTGGDDTGDSGDDTGDSGDDTADTSGGDTDTDSGEETDTGDSGDTGDTGGEVDPDCTEELTDGRTVIESEVTAEESAKYCVPGSTTAFELSGPATVVAEDSDDDGVMDHATVTLEAGGTADIIVDPSGDYTVDLDYSTRVEGEDGVTVDGGTVATLDAGDHLDAGAGVDAFMAAQGEWNTCNEDGVQDGPMDTPASEDWLYLDAQAGDVEVFGKIDMNGQVLEAGQFGTYADTLPCEMPQTDTGDTGPGDTDDSGTDTDDTAKEDTAGETGDSHRETGAEQPTQPNCGCASTPIEGQGSAVFALALAGLAVGAARRRQ